MTGRRVRVGDIVGAKVIAERLGYSCPQAISVLRHRDADFPDPIVRLGTAFGWDWSDVEAWAKKRQSSPSS